MIYKTTSIRKKEDLKKSAGSSPLLSELQETIGYVFRDESLLKHALTHSSYANEKHMKKFSDNERLEFLGDAVLEVVSSDFLYLNYPDLTEGELSKLRASIVCEPTLALCCEEISLGKYLFLGKGEDQTGGRLRKSVLSDAFEAVIGAIYLDGGFTNAKEFVLKYVMKDIEHKKLFYDSKTILQELAQSGHHVLTYDLVGESGPDHDKLFTINVMLDGEIIASGAGHKKQAAEQEGAYKAILKLQKKDNGQR